MGEIFLDKALALLSSEKQKERADGLAGPLNVFFCDLTGELSLRNFADLKHVLQQNKQSRRL